MCPMEMVACEFADVGCTAEVRRSEIPEHMQSSVTQHNLLVSKNTMDMLATMRASSCDHVLRLTSKESLQQLNEKDAKILELQDSVIALNSDLNAAREDIIKLQGELLHKVPMEGKEGASSHEDRRIQDSEAMWFLL